MFGADIPAASAENQTPHGIDLKNPFTMSKTQTPVVTSALTAALAADLMILHHWISIVSVSMPAAPSVAAKQRLVARFAALAVLVGDAN